MYAMNMIVDFNYVYRMEILFTNPILQSCIAKT